MLSYGWVDGQDDSWNRRWVTRSSRWGTIHWVGIIFLATTYFMQQVSWCDFALGNKLSIWISDLITKYSLYSSMKSILYYFGWWHETAWLLQDQPVLLNNLFNVSMNRWHQQMSNGWRKVWFITEAQSCLLRWPFESWKWGMDGHGSWFCFFRKYWLDYIFKIFLNLVPNFFLSNQGLNRFKLNSNLLNLVHEVPGLHSPAPWTEP